MPDQLPLCVWLDDRLALDASLTGGKASGLAKVRQAGIPVPPGCVLTTAAFEHARALGWTRGDSRLPAPVRRAVDSAWRSLAVASVAVRSSGTAEDSSVASLAGAFESVLDVRDLEGIEAAVGVVWSSAFADRAMAFPISDDGAGGAQMAVLIQAF